MNKIRTLAIPALAALAIAVTVPATAQAADMEAEAALKNWLAAVGSGDAARIKSVLAPEFQIMRSNGTGHDKAEYATGGAARLLNPPKITGLVTTRSGDIMVTRYWLEVKETVDGVTAEKKAPRLTVFRRIDGKWMVVGHANFAQIGK